MADTGYRPPGTMADNSAVGSLIWNNPNNAKTSNNVYTTAVGGRYGGISHYLKATNFGFSIPGDATINGIKVQYERKATGTLSDIYVRIVKAGVVKSTNRAKAGNWSTTEAYYTYGSSSDKWGTTWTPAQINASNFGVVLSTSNAPAGTAWVDYIRIKVYYTPYVPPLPNMKVNISDTFRQVSEIKINVGDSWRTVTQVKINIGDVWRSVFG